MSRPLALTLVEQAPDRRTAEVAAIEAIQAGANATQLRLAWERWGIQQRAARLRGEQP